MSRDKLLPALLRAQVVRAIYGDADRVGWQTLPLTDRTRAFNEWVEDDRIGGVLTQFMTPEQARSWIKDGPMKEYARALRGAGRYAAHGRHGGTGPLDVVRHALGAGAEVDGLVGTKPLHCLARSADGPDTAYVTWGDSRNFRNLLWAALRASVLENFDAHIVVLEPRGLTTPGDECKRQQAFADRCDLHLHHMREILGAPLENAT
jgi:hypothetical protein